MKARHVFAIGVWMLLAYVADAVDSKWRAARSEYAALCARLKVRSKEKA